MVQLSLLFSLFYFVTLLTTGAAGGVLSRTVFVTAVLMFPALSVAVILSFVPAFVLCLK